jgi:hypothetical protein
MIEDGSDITGDIVSQETAKGAIEEAERRQTAVGDVGGADLATMEIAGELAVGALEIAAEIVTLPFRLLE